MRPIRLLDSRGRGAACVVGAGDLVRAAAGGAEAHLDLASAALHADGHVDVREQADVVHIGLWHRSCHAHARGGQSLVLFQRLHSARDQHPAPEVIRLGRDAGQREDVEVRDLQEVPAIQVEPPGRQRVVAQLTEGDQALGHQLVRRECEAVPQLEDDGIFVQRRHHRNHQPRVQRGRGHVFRHQCLQHNTCEFDRDVGTRMALPGHGCSHRQVNKPVDVDLYMVSLSCRRFYRIFQHRLTQQVLLVRGPAGAKFVRLLLLLQRGAGRLLTGAEREDGDVQHACDGGVVVSSQAEPFSGVQAIRSFVDEGELQGCLAD
mmetsp:Transcript_17862/g.62691  ORF Transcript_17862/g.62691 Transcript_17862/m.62691 type:complete len:318 (+) Transcript_17862:3430-4383(+)